MRHVDRAVVLGSRLGITDNGVLTAVLLCRLIATREEIETPAIVLDVQAGESRRGTAYGCEYVRRLMEAAGVTRWEDLPGTVVRLDVDRSQSYPVQAIGHATANIWLDPYALAAEM